MKQKTIGQIAADYWKKAGHIDRTWRDMPDDERDEWEGLASKIAEHLAKKLDFPAKRPAGMETGNAAISLQQ